MSPVCPIHKSELRQLSSPLATKQHSPIEGNLTVLECVTPGCQVKYSLKVAPDWGGFFTLDSNGRPVALK